MPTSKDILEAQRFNRNRLITAFTSGTPGGREVDTPSPVRPLIFGAVVAIIVCVIGIALRSFAAKPDLTDANYKLVDVKDTGARYLSVNGVLHPISNVTTAKLLAGDSGLTIVSASTSSLKDTPRGAQIGLPGVPDDVPASADLASTWLSCDLPTSYHTWIAQDLPADNFPLQPATAALVQAVGSEDKYFIDAKTHKKYLIDASVSRLGDWVLSFQNRTAYPIIVEPEWLDLFPSGTRLKPWSYSDIPNAGEPARNLPGPLKNENLTIGTVVEQINSNGEVLNSYLVINDSDLAVFNSTAAKLYQDAPKVEQYPTEMFKDVAPVQADFIGEDWPTVEDFANPEWKDDKLDASSRTVLCTKMDTKDKTVPQFGLYTMKEQRAIQASYDAESVSATGGPTTSRTVTVVGGSGVVAALTAGGGDAGAYVFISDMGYRHSLGDAPAISLKALGWTSDDVAMIPQAWGNIIPPGSELTPQAAATSAGLS